MFKWLKDIFSDKTTYIENIPVTLETVDVFDTVWVKDDDEIRQGWIYEKTKKRFLIVVDEDEYIFHYNRPFNRTEIKYNNKILYLNEPQHGIDI